MKTRLYEGIREQVADSTSVTVNLREVHTTTPQVRVCIEADNMNDNVIPSIDNVSLSSVTVSFSTAFTGYLHLHAFSS